MSVLLRSRCKLTWSFAGSDVNLRQSFGGIEIKSRHPLLCQTCVRRKKFFFFVSMWFIIVYVIRCSNQRRKMSNLACWPKSTLYVALWIEISVDFYLFNDFTSTCVMWSNMERQSCGWIPLWVSVSQLVIMMWMLLTTSLICKVVMANIGNNCRRQWVCADY